MSFFQCQWVFQCLTPLISRFQLLICMFDVLCVRKPATSKQQYMYPFCLFNQMIVSQPPIWEEHSPFAFLGEFHAGQRLDVTVRAKVANYQITKNILQMQSSLLDLRSSMCRFLVNNNVKDIYESKAQITGAARGTVSIHCSWAPDLSSSRFTAARDTTVAQEELEVYTLLEYLHVCSPKIFSMWCFVCLTIVLFVLLPFKPLHLPP